MGYPSKRPKIQQTALDDQYTGLYVLFIAWRRQWVPRQAFVIPDDLEPVLDIAVAFGKAIKLRRTELDMSQEVLADKAELARSFVSGVERGTTKASIASVGKLAVALDCQPSDLWLLAESLVAKSLSGQKH